MGYATTDMLLLTSLLELILFSSNFPHHCPTSKILLKCPVLLFGLLENLIQFYSSAIWTRTCLERTTADRQTDRREQNLFQT